MASSVFLVPTTPGGTTTQVQFNNAGALDGVTGSVVDAATGVVQVAGLALPALSAPDGQTYALVIDDEGVVTSQAIA